MLDRRVGSIRPWEMDEFTLEELMQIEAYRDALAAELTAGG